jgi:hypothetical protein
MLLKGYAHKRSGWTSVEQNFTYIPEEDLCSMTKTLKIGVKGKMTMLSKYWRNHIL